MRFTLVCKMYVCMYKTICFGVQRNVYIKHIYLLCCHKLLETFVLVLKQTRIAKSVVENMLKCSLSQHNCTKNVTLAFAPHLTFLDRSVAHLLPPPFFLAPFAGAISLPINTLMSLLATVHLVANTQAKPR